jgi:drug/metabolite transporter (DMT)-like permease
MARATAADVGGAGFALALTSAATFGSSGTFASALFGTGWTPGAAVLVRILLAAAVLTVPALLQLRGRWAVLRQHAGSVIAFGVAAVGLAQLAYFNAVQRIPVGVALLLEYLGTILVVGWMWARHGQRPRALTVGGAAVAVVGLWFVLNTGGVHRLDPIGVLWGLGAAVGLATYFVLSSARQDARRTPMPPLVLAWAGLAIGGLTLGALAVAGALPVHAPLAPVTLAGHRTSWLVPVLGLSLVAAVVAYVTGIAAARRLGARLASFVGLAEVLAAVLFAWALLGQVPAVLQLLGGALIVAGIVLVRLDERPVVADPEPLPAAVA